MKKLIESTIISRTNNSTWRNSNNPSINTSSSLVRYSKNHNNNQFISPYFTIKNDQKNDENQIIKFKKAQSSTDDKFKRSPQTKIANILRQKSNEQQVSCLYSQHIYKSTQRDYIYEAELQKCRALLDYEKKQKLKLLAEQNQWKAQRIKLIEEKQIILFALDSLAVKMDTNHHYKKAKDVRRQTTEAGKMVGFFGASKRQSVFQTASQNQWINSKVNKMDTTAKSRKIIEDLLRENSQKQETGQKSSNKLKTLKNIHDHLSMIGNHNNISSIVEQKQQLQTKLKEISQSYNQSKIKLTELQNQVIGFKQQNQQANFKINQLNQQIAILQQSQRKAQVQIQIQKDQNKNLKVNINQMKTNNQKMIAQLNLLKMRNKQIQRQLQLTNQQYQTKEQKQKHCVKILQKFTKQLKVSDSKIQQFLNSDELFMYKQENSGDLTRSKKTYHQHLSYIIHLCKKKQTLYQSLLQQFKQKMKQNDFRTTLLQKKLTTFTQYQRSLRELAHKQASKQSLVASILKFG